MHNISFSTIDLFMGENMVTDVEYAYNHVIVRRRSSSCAMLSLLYVWLLKTLGYKAHIQTARVLYKSTSYRPRSHVITRVDIDGQSWITDPFYGNTVGNMIEPIPIILGHITYHLGDSLSIIYNDDIQAYILQCNRLDIYSFSLESCNEMDIALINLYMNSYLCDVHPLKMQLYAFRILETGEKVTLINTIFTKGTSRLLSNHHELIDILRDEFHLNYEHYRDHYKIRDLFLHRSKI